MHHPLLLHPIPTFPSIKCTCIYCHVPQLLINCLCSSHYTDHLVSGILWEICCSVCKHSNREGGGRETKREGWERVEGRQSERGGREREVYGKILKEIMALTHLRWAIASAKGTNSFPLKSFLSLQIQRSRHSPTAHWPSWVCSQLRWRRTYKIWLSVMSENFSHCSRILASLSSWRT